MSYSNRIWLYGPVSLLVMLVVGYSFFWRAQAQALSQALDRANHGEIMPGVAFAFAERTLGGFPFRLDAVLSGVTFSHPTSAGEFAWRTERLALHALSYRNDRFIFEADGLQSFARPNGAARVPNVVFVKPAIARASAILRQGRLVRFDLDVWQAVGKDATLGADPKRTFTASRAQLHLLARSDHTIDVAMKINNALIGEGYAPQASPDGVRMPLINLRAKLTEAQALEPLNAGAESLSAAVEDWRLSHGTLMVSDLVLAWPFAHADLKGDLMINAKGELTGLLEGNGVELDGKTPAGYGLVFADGDMRLVSGNPSPLPGQSPPAGAVP